MADWEDEKICRKCGYESELNKYEFCPKCGSQLLEKSELNEIDILYAKIDKYEKLGKYEEAIECYDKVIELNPSNEVLWNRKGKCFALLKRYKEAIKCYNEATRLNYSYKEAWVNKVNAVSKSGNTEEATDLAMFVHQKFGGR